METVNINQLHMDDLPWIIEYDESKCIQCGKCTAVCSFGSIKPKIERRKNPSSNLAKPSYSKVLVIKQQISFQHHCRGCGMCSRVCPNGAIKAVRNVNDRYSVRYRAAKADLPGRV